MDVYQRRRLVALSAIAAIFIVFVLLIRSCGGDDEPTTPTPEAGASGLTGATSQSKDDYIAQADPICLDANSQIAGVDTSAETADSDLSQIVSTELTQLQSLVPPDENTSDLNDFLSALDKQARAYEQKATALERGDDATAAEIDTTLDETAADAADAAASFGFEVCGDTSQVSDESSGDDSATTTDTTSDGGTVAPVTPTTTPTTETPVTPPADTGSPTPPTDTGTDTGGTGTDSGGLSP